MLLTGKPNWLTKRMAAQRPWYWLVFQNTLFINTASVLSCNQTRVAWSPRKLLRINLMFLQRINLADAPQVVALPSLPSNTASKLLLTKEQKRKLVAKYAMTPTTLHEVINYGRPDCQRHAEIQNYAINELGARVFDV